MVEVNQPLTTCMRYGWENCFNFKRKTSHSAYTDRWLQGVNKIRYMTRDEKIDRLLNCYGQVDSEAIGIAYKTAFGDSPTDNDELRKWLNDMDRLKDAMKSRGLIIPQPDPGGFPDIVFKISERGIDIVENGGWLKYLETERRNEKLKETKENRKFLVTTIISVAAVLFSIYQMFLNNDLKNDNTILVNQIDTLRSELRYKDELLKDYKTRDLEADSAQRKK